MFFNKTIKLLILLTLFLYPKLSAEDSVDYNLVYKQQPKLVYLSYSDLPKQVFLNQIFSVEIKALVVNENFEDISSMFTGGKGVEAINPSEEWKLVDSHTYVNKFYFKAKKRNVILPNLFATINLENGSVVDEELSGEFIKAIPIGKNKISCNVLANSLNIIHHKLDYYDTQTNILTLEVESKLGNIEDFKTINTTSQEVQDLNIEMPMSTASIYLILPKHQRTLRFSYFNLLDNKNHIINLPLIYNQETLSTQTNLNPRESSLEKTKMIILFVLFIVTLIFAFIRKKLYMFFISVGIGVLFFIKIMPPERVYIKANSSVYLIPTKESTILKITKRKQNAKALKKMDHYTKIILNNQIIGWVKNEDIAKN